MFGRNDRKTVRKNRENSSTHGNPPGRPFVSPTCGQFRRPRCRPAFLRLATEIITHAMRKYYLAITNAIDNNNNGHVIHTETMAAYRYAGRMARRVRQCDDVGRFRVLIKTHIIICYLFRTAWILPAFPRRDNRRRAVRMQYCSCPPPASK